MGGCVGRSVGRPSPPSADPRVRERAGCCQCAKEYQVVRAHRGFNPGTVASCDGCRRLMFEFYTGMHTSLRLLSSFLNMSPLCASEGRAAGVGPKDRLGRRQCRRREREGCGTAIERARAGGRRTSERACYKLRRRREPPRRRRTDFSPPTARQSDRPRAAAPPSVRAPRDPCPPPPWPAFERVLRSFASRRWSSRTLVARSTYARVANLSRAGGSPTKVCFIQGVPR